MAKSYEKLIKEGNVWRKREGRELWDTSPNPPVQNPVPVITDIEKQMDMQFEKEQEDMKSTIRQQNDRDKRINMQKKKEDAAEAAFPSETERRARDARKALQEYLVSDEKKNWMKKQNADQTAKAMLFGSSGVRDLVTDEKENHLQNEVDYWEGKVKQEKEAATTEADMKTVERWSDEDKAALEDYINNRQSAFVQSLNPAMTGLPADFESNPLIAKYGRQRLDQIASSYQREKNKQEYEATRQMGAEAVDKGVFSAIGANAASIGANLADTLLNPLTRIAEGAGARDERYSSLDPYSGGQAGAYASGVREETSKNIAGSEDGVQIADGITGREALALAYQGGMSALDTGARGIVAGTPVVGAGLAALSSFNNTLKEASEQGASPEQAVALATVNSAIEAATEKLPLEELFKVAKGGAKPAANVIMNILRQSGIEVLEEEASLIGTTLAEAAILQEKSSYNQQIMAAVADGATQEQAKAQADRALLDEALNTAISSGISGLFSGAGAEVFGARFVGTPEADMQAQGAQQPQMGLQERTVQTEQAQNPQTDATEVLAPDAELADMDYLFDGIRQEREDQRAAADYEWMRQTFEEAIAKKAAQQNDAARQHTKDRQKAAYEAVQAELRKQRDLEKQIMKAEQKLKETGKGSAARIDQMKAELVRQRNSVAQKQKFLDYLQGDYDKNLDSAIETQQGIFESARQEAVQAIADHENGLITDGQLKAAQDKYNAAGAELQRLKNITEDQYRADLGSVGLMADLVSEQNKSQTVESNWMQDAFRESMGISSQQNSHTIKEDSTIVNTDPAKHTPQEQAVIDAYQNAVDDNLVEYVQSVKDNPGKKMPRYSLNNVSNRAAADIQRLTGINVHGNKTEIEPRTIEHILKRHGENGAANRSMRDVNDIGRIQYVIDNYDTIEHGGTTGAYRYQDADGKQVHAQTVLIKKKVNGTYFVVEAVPDTKKKTVYIVSAYMSKNGQKETASSLVGDAEAYRYTSETKAKSDTVPKNSIPRNGKEVNEILDGAQQVDTQKQSPEGGQQKQQGTEGKSVPMQRSRPDDVRPIRIPVTDPNGRRVSEAAGNAHGSQYTPDSMAVEIEQLVKDGELGFDVRTNRQSLENAAAAIKKRGVEATKRQLTNRISHKKIQDGDIEQAILLYQKYANGDKDTDLDNASEMMVDLAAMANITGRNLQLFKLLRKMTPEGQLLAVRKEVERSVESMIRSGQVKMGYEPSIDQTLMDDYLSAAKALQKADDAGRTDAEQKLKNAQNAIYMAEAAKMPATMKAKWDSWRYMAMLGNAKTQVRNIAGNALFMPYKDTKDRMAALFEKALPRSERTKAMIQDPQLLKWAREDSGREEVQNALKYSAKLGDNVSGSVMAENRKVFDNKALEGVRKFVEKVPQAGDMLFKNDYYTRSLAGFLKARGYTAEQIRNGSVDDNALNEARNYAIREAMKATFNDSNSFSDAIAGIGRKETENPVVKVLNTAAEGILPFRRTPANIMVRFTEYSPIGIAKGVWDMANHIRSGKGSAADALDQLASGLTGTGMMYLGYMLAAGMNGVKLTGSGTDEDEKRQGHQDYALEFSVDNDQYSYRIDWAAPANLPLFVGANIYNALQEKGADPDVSNLTAVVRGMGTMFEPMLALSCLSSLNDLVEGIRYAEEGEALYSIAADVTTSYFTQGIPALARQTAQAMQETKQATFANDADPTVRDLQKTAANIPFAGKKYQTDKRNAWGETESQGDWTTRAFNAYFNPGTAKKIDNSPVEAEINRLKTAQTENVTPPAAGKTISYTDKQGNPHKDVRLTEDQYQMLAETQGKTARTILDSMITSKDYASLTDAQKAEAIKTAYSYARKTGEIAAIGEKHTGYDESWMMEMEAGKEAEYIIRRVTKSELTSAMTALDTAWDKDYDQTGSSDDLKWAYDTFQALTPDARKDVEERITGTTAKYIEARDKGVTHEQFISAAENVAKVKGTGNNGTVRDIDRRAAIANTSGLSSKQIDTIMKAYMGDYDPENGKTEKSELKYDYIRQELGLSPKAYAETYRAHLDNSKKDKKISAIMDLGYDKKTATALYKVYAGKTDVVKWYESQ